MNAKLINLRWLSLHPLRSSLRWALLIAMALSLIQPTTAYAADLRVNTLDDELNSDGDCSLREAITAANSNTVVDACPAGSGKQDTILFKVIGTITLQSPLPTITANLEVVGPGKSELIIGGYSGASGHVFVVNAGVMLRLRGVAVADNSGGAILNYGTLNLENVIISGNGGGGVSGDGGGGIANYGGTVMIRASTISSNKAQPGVGGGVANFAFLPYQYGTITIVNSTISGNEGYLGGGVFNTQFNSSKTIGIKLINSTIAFNQVGTGIYNFVGRVDAVNTIIANNTSTFGPGDCAGNAMTSNGHNLDSDGSCPLNAEGDLSNTDPLLGPLAYNGGLTQIHALLPGSPAIDSGRNELCPTSDQRGFQRPADGNGDGIAICDIGSFEVHIK